MQFRSGVNEAEEWLFRRGSFEDRRPACHQECAESLEMDHALGGI